MSDFLKAHILGMAGMILFRFGMCSLLICRHLHSEVGVLFEQEIMELQMCVKSYFVLCVNILMLCVHARFLGLHNTLP